MTEFEWEIERESHGLFVRGTYTEHIFGAPLNTAGMIWWGSVDGERWILIGATSSATVERVFEVTDFELVKEAVEMIGWAWGEVTTQEEAAQRTRVISATVLINKRTSIKLLTADGVEDITTYDELTELEI